MYVRELESSQRGGVWIKVKISVDQAGPEKSVQQCKDKFRKLKDSYKAAKDHNKKTGVDPFCLHTLHYLKHYRQLIYQSRK